MGGALRRYIKKHFKNVTIKRELWEELRRLADEEGLTIPELVAKMYRVYTIRRGLRAIPVHKTITTDGEVAYALTLDGETITLTHRELRVLCKSGLIDIVLCSKTILGG
jgi:hypothetical protein